MATFEPKPGYLFVERDEQPDMSPSGRIWIPQSVVRAKKSTLGTIRALADDVHDFTLGDRVAVQAGVGRRLEFDNGLVLYVCEPKQILAIGIDDGDETRIETTDHWRSHPSLPDLWLYATDRRAEEGAVKRGGE